MHSSNVSESNNTGSGLVIGGGIAVLLLIGVVIFLFSRPPQATVDKVTLPPGVRPGAAPPPPNRAGAAPGIPGSPVSGSGNRP